MATGVRYTGVTPSRGLGAPIKAKPFFPIFILREKKESNKSAPYGAPDGVAAVDVHFVAIKIFFFSASLEVRKRFQETCDEIGNSKKKLNVNLHNFHEFFHWKKIFKKFIVRSI